jgi:isoamylase
VQAGRPLLRPFTKTIIYEMHVGAFTRQPNSAVALGRRSTYARVIDEIPYLQDLGVSAVELLPVSAFDCGTRI